MSHLNVLVGNPAEEIIRFAEERKIDLIVMASRGKSGFSRWYMGNIAEKVIRLVGIPVLLIKPSLVSRKPNQGEKGSLCEKGKKKKQVLRLRP